MNFWARLEQAPWVEFYAKSIPLDSFIAALHYFSFFILVGTAALVDLRLLGVLNWKQRSLQQVARQVFPWMWTSLVIAIVTGFLLFTTEADEFVASKTFWAKLIIMVVGIVVAAVIQRNTSKWDQQPLVPGNAKLLAVISLVIWLGVMLAGVEIANYNAV